MKLAIRLFVGILVLSSVSALCAAADGARWLSGSAKTVITPEQPMWMAGYGGRTEPATSKVGELFAKAMVLEIEGGTKSLVLSLDLVGIDRTLSDRIKVAISKKVGLPAANVAICTSHTHCGPVVGMNLGAMHYNRLAPEQQVRVREYAERLFDKCVEVAAAAEAAKQPSTVQWGTGHADFAVNRRNNKEPEVPSLRTEGKLVGPFDHDVPVLIVRDSAGSLKTILFGYACHATVLSWQSWCGDYPGFAQAELEARYPGSVAMFYAGCGADQNPLPRRTVELAQHYGRRLADAVDAVMLTSKMNDAPAQLSCVSKDIDIPLAELPTVEQLKVTAASTNGFEASRASLLLQQIDSGKPLSKTYPYPIGVWRIGGGVSLVFLGGEVVVDYSLRIKDELKGPAWVAAYSNDVMAYIPSRRVLAEGGYEGATSMVYYGLPTIWAPEIEEGIVQAVKSAAADAE